MYKTDFYKQFTVCRNTKMDIKVENRAVRYETHQVAHENI